MRRLAGLAVSAAVIASATGCVTSLPTPPPGPAPLPSLAASLPGDPAPPSASARPAVSAASSASAVVSRSPAPGPATTTTAAGRPPLLPAATPKPAAPATAHVPTSAELRRALLGGSDLAGFRVDNGADDGAGGTGGCAALDTDFSAGATASADVLMLRTTPSAFIRERLRQLTVTKARAALSRVRSAPRNCPSYLTTVSGLGQVTVTVGALGTPRAGDDTTAVRITMRPEAVAVVAIENLVVARRGGTLIVVTHTGIGSIEDGLTSAAVTKAYQKTARVW